MSNNKEDKTSILREGETKRNWFLLDATGKTLGRLSSEITKILRGKHKPAFTDYMDCGDGIVVINAEKIKVTGNKAAQKEYIHYAGGQAMSGLRRIPYRTMMARKPTYILEHAVKGIMPKTRLGKQQLKKLRIFAGQEHDLVAQKPIQVNI